MRKIVLWIAVVLAVVFVAVSIAELQNMLNALSRGNWLFLILALLLAIGCLVNNSFTYKALYRLLGMSESIKTLFLLSTGATFVNLIAPSGGIGGIAVFIDNAKQHNQSPARVMVAGILYGIYEYVTLLCVLALGFITLIRRNNLTTGEIIAVVWLFLLTVGFALILIIGYRSSERLGRIMFKLAGWLNRIFQRFFHRDAVNAESAHVLAAEIAEGVNAIKENKGKLIRPFFFAFGNKAILIAVLISIFEALGVPWSPGTVVAGYSIGQLFFYVTPTPAGIGFVESIFPFTLNMLNVQLSFAVLITLIYRGFTVWLTFAIGFYSFRKLQRSAAAQKQIVASE